VRPAIPGNPSDPIREGQAQAAMRRKAAAGEISLPPVDKLEVLLALSDDSDTEISAQARRTLQNWDSRELGQVLAGPDIPHRVLDAALENPALARDEVLEALFRNPAFSEPGEAWPSPPSSEGRAPLPAAAKPTRENESLLQRISRMTVSEKIRAALLGGADERLILIRESNKAVTRAVLYSPKLTDREVEAIATMRNVDEEVLRLIAAKRSFVRHYSIVNGLANNPRAPIDVVLPLLARLNDRDLKALSINRNVADAVRKSAGRLSKARQGAH
jgi:hypothetical protein